MRVKSSHFLVVTTLIQSSFVMSLLWTEWEGGDQNPPKKRA